jgi:hypothetical protein
MKTTARFTDGSSRVIRIHLSRNGEPFAVVFDGVSYRATGNFTGTTKATRMYEMRNRDGAVIQVDAAGAHVRN